MHFEPKLSNFLLFPDFFIEPTTKISLNAPLFMNGSNIQHRSEPLMHSFFITSNPNNNNNNKKNKNKNEEI